MLIPLGQRLDAAWQRFRLLWRPVQCGIRYVQGRFKEKSTMAAIVAALGTAALIPPPWSYWVYAGQVLLAMYPEKRRKNEEPDA